LHCPEVTSKVAKYDEHVDLARMEGKVCWLETIHVIFSQLKKIASNFHVLRIKYSNARTSKS
jgi:hypothetical protein